MSKSSKQIIDTETEYDIFHLEGYLCELPDNSFIPIKTKKIKKNSDQEVNLKKEKIFILKINKLILI